MGNNNKKEKKVSEYKIAALESDRHQCQAVVLRPINYAIRKPIINFLKFIGISSYDLVTFSGGSLRIIGNNNDIKKDIIDALLISKNLHNAKEIINFLYLPDQDIKDFKIIDGLKYCDQDILEKDLRKIKENLKKEIKDMNIKNYLLKLSDDKKNIIFFEVKENELEKIFLWPFYSQEKEALALRCMDFRFRDPTKTFLESIYNFKNYDLISYPGAGKSILEKKEKSLAFLTIESAIKKHGNNKVLLINHIDCGAYGGSKAFENKDAEKEFMISETKKALSFLREKFPETKFIGLLEFFKDGYLSFENIN